MKGKSLLVAVFLNLVVTSLPFVVSTPVLEGDRGFTAIFSILDYDTSNRITTSGSVKECQIRNIELDESPSLSLSVEDLDFVNVIFERQSVGRMNLGFPSIQLTVNGKHYKSNFRASHPLHITQMGFVNLTEGSFFTSQVELIAEDNSTFIGDLTLFFAIVDESAPIKGTVFLSGTIIDNQEERISTLESVVQSLQSMVLNLKNWLFFKTYSDDTLCNAVVTECGVSNIPEPEEPSNDTVIFRTNIVQGDYGGQDAPRWIALDRDGDETLEGYGFIQKAAWDSARCSNLDPCPGSLPCSLMKTPTFDDVVDYGSSDKLLVCSIRNDQQVIFQRGSERLAVLS